MFFDHKGSAGEIKPFAEIARVLFEHRLRAPFAALVGGANIVARAIQADPQVRPAAMARLAAPRLHRQRPFPAALVAMSCHAPSMKSVVES